MPGSDIITLLLLAALLLALLFGLLRPVVAFFISVCVLYLSGIVALDTIVKGFSNESVLSVMALLGVSTVVAKTTLRPLLYKLCWDTPGSFAKMLALASSMSTLTNNTFVVSLFLRSLGKRDNLGKILLPISYVAILGGTCTLIGTSTNLIVNGLAQQQGLPPLNMFDFALVGVPLVLAGVLYMVFIGSKLLPQQTQNNNQSDAHYFLEARVQPGSPLIGKSISDNKLRNLESLFLAEMIRNEQLISPVSPDEKLQGGDVLVFTGDIGNIRELQNITGLEVFEEENSILGQNLVRAVLSHRSRLVGRTIKAVNFRSEFDAAVVAINRGNEQLAGKLGGITLQAGDQLVLAAGQDFKNRKNMHQHFYTLDELEVQEHFNLTKSLLTIAPFLLLIILNSMGIVSLFKGLIILILYYIAMRFTNFWEIRRSVDIHLYVILSSALVMASALIQTGAVNIISDSMLGLTHGGGVYGQFIGIYCLTVLLTELLNNGAAAAFTLPLALAAAQTLGVSPTPFVFAVAYAASGGFLIPYGYQTHMMVYSAGGYRLVDFLRVGAGMALIYGIIVTLLVPVFFPF